MTCTPQELKARIEGVVVGLPTLYHEDYSLNYAGMRAHVEVLIDSAVNVLMISRGVSELPYLTFAEIKALTKNAVEAAAGRVPVITSASDWWTGQTIEFANYARDAGADGCLVVLPPIYCSYSPTLHDDSIYAHFEAIARATDIGLVIHERNMADWRGAGTPLSISLLERLAGIEDVVGLKLEGGDRFYAQQVVRKTRDRLAIIGDWGPESWLFSYDYGVRANIAGMGTYAPKLEVQVWDHVREGRLAEARRLINDVMTPYWVEWIKMDWVAAMKVSMEFVGLPASPMRPPSAQLTPDQRERLRQAMLRLGLLE